MEKKIVKHACLAAVHITVFILAVFYFTALQERRRDAHAELKQIHAGNIIEKNVVDIGDEVTLHFITIDETVDVPTFFGKSDIKNRYFIVDTEVYDKCEVGDYFDVDNLYNVVEVSKS